MRQMVVIAMFGMESWVILEAGLIVALAIGVISLFYKLNEKRANNERLIGALGEVEQHMTDCRKNEDAATQKLTSYRQWYRGLFNELQDIVLVHGLDSNEMPQPFVEANDVACKMLGYERDELLSKTMVDIQDVEIPVTAGFLGGSQIDEQVKKLATKIVANTLGKVIKRDHVSYEDFLRTKTGQKLPVMLSVFKRDLMGKPMIMWVGRDVTELREGQRAVKESERRLKDFFSHSPLGIAMYDADRKLITVNTACLRMFGFPDYREFERFNMFDNPFLPPDAKHTLAKAESVHCEVVVDFDNARHDGLFVSTRDGKGHYDMLISNLGCDLEYRPRGYFAQIQDVTQRRKVEADLRKLQTVGADTEAVSGISGDLEDVPLTDMMQILCVGGKDMEIKISHRNLRGQVFIQKGDIIHCAVEGKQGEDAFYDLMRWHEGKFTAEPCEKFPARTITVSAMALLMEGARRFDEGQSS
jgi:PAS domain S-box-containing protein